MLRAGDCGGSVFDADRQQAPAECHPTQKTCSMGVVFNTTVATMVVNDDLMLSDLDIDLQKIIDGCECWSPDDVLPNEQDTVDIPNSPREDSEDLCCNDIPAVFERYESTTTVVVKKRQITYSSQEHEGEDTRFEKKALMPCEKSMDMSREERQAIRKHKNRLSASKSRALKKKQVETYEETISELREENRKYRALIAKLEGKANQGGE